MPSLEFILSSDRQPTFDEVRAVYDAIPPADSSGIEYHDLLRACDLGDMLMIRAADKLISARLAIKDYSGLRPVYRRCGDRTRLTPEMLVNG